MVNIETAALTARLHHNFVYCEGRREGVRLEYTLSELASVPLFTLDESNAEPLLQGDTVSQTLRNVPYR